MGPTSASPVISPRKDAGAGDKEVRKQVRGLISAMLYGPADVVERRHEVRCAFPQPVYLTAVGEDGITPDGESIMAVGKDLSESGLGFYHDTPLPSRRMVVSLQMGDGRWLAFVIELTRSRLIRQGWYESGGRFLENVPSPMETATSPTEATAPGRGTSTLN
jgi:hypothetical protein